MITETTRFIEASEYAMQYYEEGTIVCDLPVMNYVFIHKYKIPHENIISNHYTPLHYGIQNFTIVENWFKDRNATLWIKTYRADSGNVHKFIMKNDPSFFELVGSSWYGTSIYRLNYS